MKKIFLTLATIISFGIIANAQESKLRIAVIDIYCTESDWRYYEPKAKEITSILTTELVNTNKYRVLERSRIDQVIKEQGFQSTQNISAHAVELGKLLGIHKIITGEFSRNTTNIRLIDVESGDIEKAITVKSSKYDKKRGWWTDCEEIAKKILAELLK
jgi:ribosome maturation protein Sdo1